MEDNRNGSVRRRNFLIGGLGVAAGLGLAACTDSRATSASGGSSSPAASAGSSSPAASASLSAYMSAHIDWKQFSGTQLQLGAETHPWMSAITPLLPEFTRLTGITVTPSVLGEDQYVTKIAVELSGGSATPDVFMIDQFGQAASAGWLEPLDGYLSNTKLTDPTWYAVDDFFPGARSFSTGNGQTLAMPITSEAQMLFVRSDLVQNVPATFDELPAAAAAANKGGIAGFGSRADANANETPWPFGGFTFTEGGFYIDESGQPALGSPAAIKALTLYQELLTKYGPKGVSSWGFLENEQAMQQGKLAMWTDSSTFLGDLRDPTQSKAAANIDAYPFPSVNGTSVPNVWYWTVGINPKSSNKEAAWLFLQWATSKPVSNVAGLVGASPARVSTWQAPDTAAKIGTANAQRILNELQAANSKPMALAWQNAKWSQVADVLARAVNSAVTGASPMSALTSAQAQAKSIMG